MEVIKIKKILIFTSIFVFIFSSISFAVTDSEIYDFIDRYPNPYIYKVVFPNNVIYVISSPVRLEFGLSDKLDDGTPLISGKAFVIKKNTSDRYYILTNSGNVNSYTWELQHIVRSTRDRIGIEGDIDIYRWNGSSFFLPTPSTFQRDLVGQIQTILPVGFGILSATLLIPLLVVYFKRYLHRLI